MPGRRLILLAFILGALAFPAVAGATGAPLLSDPSAPSTPAPAFVPGRVIVEWAPGTERGEKTEAREEAEVTFQSNLGAPAFQLVKVEPGQSVGEAIEELEGEPAVLVAERDAMDHPLAVPNDPLFDEQWALQNIGATINEETGVPGDDINVVPAWDRTVGTPNIVVADIDGGYNFNSPDLGPVAWKNPGEIAGNGFDDDHNGYVDDVHGWDFVGPNWEAPTEDNEPTEEDPFDAGHGIHTAGIIGAAGNNGVGITGVAQNVRIMPLRVCASAPGATEQGCPGSSIIAAINYAGRNGARVANLSLGGGGTSTAEVDAFADHPGTLYVIAAGNNTSDNDLVPEYPCDAEPGTSGVPGAIENIVCVAATGQFDQLANFSDYGANSVDLGAPGKQILSVYPAREVIAADNFEGNDFATRWEEGLGVEAGFELTHEAPLTSFGMSDSPGHTPIANSRRGSRLSAPITVPAGDGQCWVRLQASVKPDGGTAAVFLDKVGGSEGGFGLPETNGSEMRNFSVGPFPTDLAGSNVELEFLYEAGPSPNAEAGFWVDNVKLECTAPLSTPSAWGYLEGTSMAAPMVSGAAALLYSLKPSATVEEVEYALFEGVDPDPALAGKTVTGGRLDVDASMDWLEPPAPVISTSPASPAADTAPRIVGSVKAGTRVKIFSGTGCHGAPEATGSPAELESPGLVVSVPNGTTKQFSALVETRYASSSCSAPVSYTNSTAPPTISVPLVEPHPSESTSPSPTPKPAPSCNVPKLAGKSLAKAKAALKRAGCTLGKVTEPKGPAKRKKGALVVATSTPAAGAKSASPISLRLAPPRAKHRR
jgi:subtilisin family serine protease